MKNPILSNGKIVLSYFLIWTVIAFFHFSADYFFAELDFVFSLSDALTFNFIYALLGFSLWFPAQFLSIENYSLPKLVLNHLLAATVTSFIWITAASFILSKAFYATPDYSLFLQSTFIWRLLIGVIYYSILTSLYYLVIYYRNSEERKIKQIELEKLVNEAEIKSLKYQINPHFIFNSLNSISSLTVSNPSLAQAMTIKLADFLRAILSRNDKSFNSIKEELDLVKLYLEIEKLRFEDKFDLIIENENECAGVKVPNMLLQPLAENAIKYGVYEAIDKITIKIRCIPRNGVLEIRFINDYDPDSIPRHGEGIGLKNIAERLRLIYGQSDLLQIEKTNNKFIVKIFIPDR